MNLSKFLKILERYYCEDDLKKGDFVLRVFDNILEDIDTDDIKYNPVESYTDNSRRGILNGSVQLSVSKASDVLGKIDKVKFENYILEKNEDVLRQLCADLKSNHIDCDTFTVGEICADLFVNILREIVNINKINTPVQSTLISIPINNGKAVFHDGKIIFRDNIYTFPEYVQDEDHIIELPFVTELINAYNDTQPTPKFTDSNSLKGRYKQHFLEQKIAYINADYVRHGIREIFEDGEEQFELLKDELYDGISDTYYDDYDNGYKRLLAVLKQAVSSNLNAGVLETIDGLIQNTTRKGICHILVNDGKIRSWVDIDE